MQANCMSGSMRRGEKRVMVHSVNGHRTRKGGNGGAPPDLYTNALVPHSTPLEPPHREDCDIGGDVTRLMRRELSGMPGLNPTTSCCGRAIASRFHQLRAFPERCPRMTCSTNSSPNRLVNGPERNNKR